MPSFVLLDRLLARFLRRRPARPWGALAVATPALIALLALPAVGCATATNARAKLDDAVQETNVAARFGRGDIAVERVHATARDAFVKHHRRWGSDVRIVDVELGGIERMSGQEAVVLVTFGWFRPDEGRLRTTVLRQTWRTVDESGWWLFAEDQASGDVGLLDEPAKKGDANSPAAPKEPPRPRYETTTIPGD
jgi:hypothetical protein